MQISRVIIDRDGDEPLEFVLDPDVAIVDGRAHHVDLLADVLAGLFRGTKGNARIFAGIEGIEIELTDQMVPLIGDRFGGDFQVIDLSAPVPLPGDDAGPRAATALAVRAALETTEHLPARLTVDDLDRGLERVDELREPFADRARREGQIRRGLRALFDRRDAGWVLRNSTDRRVVHLAELEETMTDRRRQIVADTPPTPIEYARAHGDLRDLLHGLTGERTDHLSDRDIRARATAWLAADHADRIVPFLKRRFARHAGGVSVLGAVPCVIDLRHEHGDPPGSTAVTEGFGNHRRRLQFIVLRGADQLSDWMATAIPQRDAMRA